MLDLNFSILFWRRRTYPRSHLRRHYVGLSFPPIAVASKVTWRASAHRSDVCFVLVEACANRKICSGPFHLSVCVFAPLQWTRTRPAACLGWNQRNRPFWRSLKMMLVTKRDLMLTLRYVVVWLIWLTNLILWARIRLAHLSVKLQIELCLLPASCYVILCFSNCKLIELPFETRHHLRVHSNRFTPPSVHHSSHPLT